MTMIAFLDRLLDFDLWVEGFSLIITFLIAAFSMRAYFLTKQKKQLWFSAGFFSITIGLLLMFVFNTLVDIEDITVAVRGYLPITYWLGITLMASMLALLAGYMTIFVVNEKFVSRKTLFLLYAFIIMAVLVAHDFYFMYHLTAFLILAMVFNHYYWNNRKYRTPGTLMSMLAFTGLLLSHGVTMFTPYSAAFYVLGHAVQLISYALLLAVVLLALRGKR